MTIFLHGLGWLAFTAGTIILGAWLRKNPSKQNVEKTSRILHFVFWIGLFAGSTYLTLAALLVAIPLHVFYLKYFEEYELELRMDPSYLEYKRKVPFLLPRLGSLKD